MRLAAASLRAAPVQASGPLCGGIDMTFDEAVAKGSPRILRNLKIDEVSSVTSGAGRGVRVVLAKHHPLNKEATMATVRCPKCGHEDTAEKFAKGAGQLSAPYTRS